jgi:hypothetical protein
VIVVIPPIGNERSAFSWVFYSQNPHRALN